MQIGREEAIHLNFPGNVVSQRENAEGFEQRRCWSKLSRSQNNSVLFLQEKQSKNTKCEIHTPKLYNTPSWGQGWEMKRVSCFVGLHVYLGVSAMPLLSQLVEQLVGEFFRVFNFWSYRFQIVIHWSVCCLEWLCGINYQHLSIVAMLTIIFYFPCLRVLEVCF